MCSAGHCFDIAQKGYVNFVPRQRATKYTRALLQSRRVALESGLYETFLEELQSLLVRFAPQATHILDAGCGEGFYTQAIAMRNPAAALFGLDIEKEAVQLAAKRQAWAAWLVADIANIPFLNDTMDVILNLFTLSHYESFLRVLRPGGILIKAMPGETYLQEIRARAPVQNKTHSSAPVSARMAQRFETIASSRVCRTYPVQEEQLSAFLNMTPLLMGKDRLDQEAYRGITSLTIDIELEVGQNVTA